MLLAAGSYKLQPDTFSIYNINQVTVSLEHISKDLMINWHVVFEIKYISKIILNIFALFRHNSQVPQPIRGLIRGHVPVPG